jgi:hypothetical protein
MVVTRSEGDGEGACVSAVGGRGADPGDQVIGVYCLGAWPCIGVAGTASIGDVEGQRDACGTWGGGTRGWWVEAW